MPTSVVTYTVQSQGTIAPRTQTSLVAEAQGQIVAVSDNFVSGRFFRKGDVLVRIDPRNYASAVKRTRANVAKAATQLETESAMAGYAKEDYERLRRANPRTGPASNLALRKPQMRQALAELRSAEADLEKAEGDLDRTVIRAPYDGLVRQKICRYWSIRQHRYANWRDFCGGHCRSASTSDTKTTCAT